MHHRRTGSQPQLSARLSFEGVHVEIYLPVNGNDGFGVAQEHISDSGQANLVTPPVEKRRTKPAFEFLNVLGEGGLGHNNLAAALVKLSRLATV